MIFILIFFIQNIKEKNFSISEKKLLTKISNKKEYIIFGGLVYGMNNFQYLLENPKIIMMNPQMNYYHNEHSKNIFCNNGKKFKKMQTYYNSINEVCFKNKSMKDWLDIKNKFNAKYVITPKKQNLNVLNKIGSVKNFNIFEIK